MNWHNLTKEKIFEELNSGEEGLSNEKIESLQNKYGLNELVGKPKKSFIAMIWGQVSETLILLLLASAIAAGFLGDTTDSLAIFFVVILFVALGIIQEFRAEKAMEALKQFAKPIVKVIRSSQIIEISSTLLVPGDILILEEGNLIPTDSRVIETANLQVQESSLTGESEPILKTTDPLQNNDTPLADRTNMVFMGTLVTKGRGRAIVVATGMQTELGSIAKLVDEVEAVPTPLQEKLNKLGKNIAVIAIIISIAIFIMGYFRGEKLTNLVLTAVSLAVAIIPEGLPAVVTITLALGAQRMIKKRALIRNLPAVETLGSVTIICTDKTGTLTQNKMKVNSIWNTGESTALDMVINENSNLSRSHNAILITGILCNDAKISDSNSGFVGDPTEGALLLAGIGAGFDKLELETSLPRSNEIAFDSERKCMTTLHKIQEKNKIIEDSFFIQKKHNYIAFTKGAPEKVLDSSKFYLTQSGIKQLTAETKIEIKNKIQSFAEKGFRTIAFSFRTFETAPTLPELEKEIIFCGIENLIDPPREEVYKAVRECLGAGIRPIMITGDHPATALAIAKKIGITSNDNVITGVELEIMSEEEFDKVAGNVSVFARVAPSHKMKIIHALQKRSHKVSMTGDGVNDAPALKKADIGVSMGIAGTDVAKEASDIVLLDDNFVTIVSAIEQGRMVYDNIRSYIKYSIAGNLGKSIVMFFGPILGTPLPLTPLQLLWLNLLTDGLIGLGLGLEPPDPFVMKRKPFRPDEGIFSHGLGSHILWVGLYIGSISLGLGVWYFTTGRENWQTIMFANIAFMQVVQGFAIRSSSRSIFRISLFSNPVLLVVGLVAILTQFPVIYYPPLQEIFGTKPLLLFDFLTIIAASVSLLIFVELEKFIGRYKK